MKGGYFKFFSKIKQAKKEFKALKESKVYRLKDKLKFKNEEDFDLFIKNYALIENLLTHYEALNEVIVLNMAFVLEHFDEVSLWLNSKEFKEKYEDINHPYPPLLNPDKLNDENYILNYEKIPANLAWEMNLPLPRMYKFLFWGSHGVGNTGIHTFLYQSGFIHYTCLTSEGSKATYLYQYNGIMNHKKIENVYLTLIDYFNDEDCEKLGYLYPDTPTLHQVRDPISTLKTHTTTQRLGRNYKRNIHIDDDVRKITKNRVGYWSGRHIVNNPSFIGSLKIIEDKWEVFHDFLLRKRLKNIKHINIIDGAELVGEKGEKTMMRLSKKFDFTISNFEKNKKIFSLRIAEYSAIFPIFVDCRKYFKCFICLTKIQLMDKNYININAYFNFKDEEFIACVHKDELEKFQQNISKINLYKDKLAKIALALEKLKKQVDFKRSRVKEEQLLDYLKRHPNIAKKFKEILDEKHLSFIKKERPDIVDSWKYYKEFEKMCEDFKE
ncbi:DUF2972 domain-containing protein [Campylobacter upsaliensis]|uniref:DUF2972 domain-containing protein n=2 Tax=Campylobacter upsaliensis TaxID=28080 RepID=UPI0022EA108D|nr:DUF2972 domain-containing protein [Campylobacter upsaliensis]